MEIQVETHGTSFDLKIVLVWIWLFHIGFQILISIVQFKVMYISTSTFLNHNLFENHHMHLIFLFCIAKGLATFRLGGVISAQKVQF